MASDNDIKEELSYAYLHAVAASAGMTVSRPSKDRDSIDAVVEAKGFLEDASKIRSPRIEVQLKGHALAPPKADTFPYPLSIKNYNDLRHMCLVPRYLVVLLLPLRRNDWVSHSPKAVVTRRCAYWLSLLNAPARTNTDTVTVQVPLANQLTPANLFDLLLVASHGNQITWPWRSP